MVSVTLEWRQRLNGGNAYTFKWYVGGLCQL